MCHSLGCSLGSVSASQDGRLGSRTLSSCPLPAPPLPPSLQQPLRLPQDPQYRPSQPSELPPVPHSPPLAGLLAGCGPAVGAQAPPVRPSGARAGGQVAPPRSSFSDVRRCPHAGHRSRGQSSVSEVSPVFTRGSGAGAGCGYSRTCVGQSRRGAGRSRPQGPGKPDVSEAAGKGCAVGLSVCVCAFTRERPWEATLTAKNGRRACVRSQSLDVVSGLGAWRGGRVGTGPLKPRAAPEEGFCVEMGPPPASAASQQTL